MSLFGFFKPDPRATLEKQYKKKLSDAMNAQRNGDIRLYSELSEVADDIRQKLDALDNAKNT